jgi:hypothetical protein
VQEKILLHLPVSLDNLLDTPGSGLRLLVDRGRCNQPLDVKMIRIRKEADEGLRVVGLVFDVGEDEYTMLWLDGKGIGTSAQQQESQ